MSEVERRCMTEMRKCEWIEEAEEKGLFFGEEKRAQESHRCLGGGEVCKRNGKMRWSFRNRRFLTRCLMATRVGTGGGGFHP